MIIMIVIITIILIIIIILITMIIVKVEQFRLRCYMASLQSGELPNPKVNSFS